MEKRKLFVGSSQEAVTDGALEKLIEAIKVSLPDIDIVSWKTDTDWQNLNTPLSTLLDSIGKYTYAVFLGWLDDVTTIRNNVYYTTRDNVIFEFGMFLSRLGKECCFLVTPIGGDLPKDQSGAREYRVCTDIKGGYMAGTFSFDSSPPSRTNFTFNINDLIKKIEIYEQKLIPATCDNAKDMLSHKIEDIRSTLKKENRDNSFYINSFKDELEKILSLKSLDTGLSYNHLLDDLLKFLDYEQDVCDIKELARVQHHSNNTELGEVWVFADEPLEFQNKNGGGFDELRETIRTNLLNGVKYKYFISNKIENIRAILGSSRTPSKVNKMLKNLSFFIVDKKLFKTYFTLHISKNNSAKVYMSALREERRKDLLIQISDASHIKRIKNNIELLFGKEQKIDGCMYKNFTE